jgi:hypothetical protein
MNQRPLVLLFPAAALGLAAVIYAVNRCHARTRAEISALGRELQSERVRIDDLSDYLQPLRGYALRSRS